MPQVSAAAYVPIPPERAFAVFQTTVEVRLRWDPFISSQHFLGGATRRARACGRSPAPASDPGW